MSELWSYCPDCGDWVHWRPLGSADGGRYRCPSCASRPTAARSAGVGRVASSRGRRADTPRHAARRAYPDR